MKIKAQKTVRNGFYESFRIVMLSGRIIGIVPISGLSNHTSEFIRIRWKTPYTLIIAFFTILKIISFGFIIYDNMHSKFQLKKIVDLIYTASNLVSTLLIIYICTQNWDRILKKIEFIERRLPSNKDGSDNVKKIYILVIVMFLACIVNFITFSYFSVMSTKNCSLLDDDSGLYLKSYFITVLDWCFPYITFNYVVGFFLWLTRQQTLYQVNFDDSLIMVVSMYLSKLFEDFNEVLSYKLKNVDIIGANKMSWLELQKYFTRLTNIVKIVDRQLNPFVLLSFLVNLLYLGQVMFYALTNTHSFGSHDSHTNCHTLHKDDWQRKLFMITTSIYVVFRIMLVSFLAGRLHAYSRLPLKCLHTMPAAAYDYDAQMFIDQVYHSKIGLSGLDLFIVTPKMLVTMFATLVTYELVILQFKH